MESKTEKTKLEKRIGAFRKQIDFVGNSINNTDGLREMYSKVGDDFFDNIKEQFPLKYIKKLLDWEKHKSIYQKGIDILIEECSDGMLKEFEVIRGSRCLTDEALGKGLPELITKAYGSLDGYTDYGASLKKCSKNLYGLLNEEKFSIAERITIKQFYKLAIKGLEMVGQEIIDASKEAKLKSPEVPVSQELDMLKEEWDFYQQNKTKLLAKHENMYVAIKGKRVLGIEENLSELEKIVYEKYPELEYEPVLFQKIEKEPTIYYMRKPR